MTKNLIANGFARERIVNLGFSVNPPVQKIIDSVAGMIPAGHQGMLVGFVNIHTPQAELLMEYFEHLRGGHVSTSLLNAAGMMARQKFEHTHLPTEASHA